jgi:hypothetical protein
LRCFQGIALYRALSQHVKIRSNLTELREMFIYSPGNQPSRPPSQGPFSKVLGLCRVSWLFAAIIFSFVGPHLNAQDFVQEPQKENNFQPRAYQGRLEPDDGQWLRPARDLASTRCSALDQINTGNVKTLKLAFTFSTGQQRGHEAAPLVVNNTMYIVTPWPDNFVRLGFNQTGGASEVDVFPSADACFEGRSVLRRGESRRGLLRRQDLLQHTGQPDRRRGCQYGRDVWKVRLGDINKGETITMAPLVVKDKVLVGNSGGEMGIRGWLMALDAKTGKLAWRAFSTGPDKDVKMY